MGLSATSVRRTALSEKVYAKAAEIERAKEELKALELKAAKKALNDVSDEDSKLDVVVSFRKRSAKEVLKLVSDHFQISYNQMVGPEKPEAIITARHIAMYMAYKHTGASLPQVGIVFKRDHTTVMYAVHKIERLVKRGGSVAADVERLRVKIYSYDLNDMPYWGA